jgi:adenylate kinase family enzyme
MKILVFGLPGSGKSTFAKQLTAETNIPHFNADEIRGMFKDWDFSQTGRIRQVTRMMAPRSSRCYLRKR